jgi:hypothetical protein
MPDLKLVDPGRQADFADLHAQFIDYADRVEELRSQDQVLNELHARLGLQAWDASWIDLSCWRAVGGVFLVAQRALQHCEANDAGH